MLVVDEFASASRFTVLVSSQRLFPVAFLCASMIALCAQFGDWAENVTPEQALELKVGCVFGSSALFIMT